MIPAASVSSPTSRDRKSQDIIARGFADPGQSRPSRASGPTRWSATAAGCLIQMPDALLRDWAGKKGLTLPAARTLCRRPVCFLPSGDEARDAAIEQCRALHPGRRTVADRLA